MRPGWLIGVPFSLVLHVALAAAVIALFRGGQGPPSLIVDLTAIVAPHEDGSSSSAGAPAPPPASRAGAKTGSARSERGVARDGTSVVSPPVAAPTEPPPPAAVATSRETPPPSPSTAVGAAPAADVAAPIASQSLGPSAVVGSRRQDGVGVDAGAGAVGSRGAVGAGGAGGDHIAALGIAGGGGSGASDYAAYLARLRQRIQETLRYPPAARRRGVTGTVHLEIAIEPDGAVGAVSVIASSAHEILDRAAVDAARSVPRLPFPDDVRPRGLRVRLPVVFELQ
jgi:protein TonB